MDQCGVEREKVPSSDCDEDEALNLLTVINEHSEVIRLIEDDRDNNSQIGQNGVADSNEIEIFHHPPDNLESDSDETNSLNDNPNGNGDESGSGQNNSGREVNEDDSDSEDQEHYMVYQEENNGIENNIYLPEIPIINYAGDVEHEEDFENDWEWTEKDPGSSCGLFTSQPGLLIEPASCTPEGFFNLLFDNSMWTLLAQQTKHLCETKDTTIKGYYIILIFISSLFLFTRYVLNSSSYFSHCFMVFHL